MFKVLIPSLYITNPLTLNLSPIFWVIRSFPIPLETIKRRGDYYLICASQVNPMALSQHFYRYSVEVPIQPLSHVENIVEASWVTCSGRVLAPTF